MALLDQSSRVALAALLHDLGKFSQRAQVDYKPSDIDFSKQQYCPKQERGGRQWHTHVHAAYTALSIESLSQSFPALFSHGDFKPFSSFGERTADDSLLNAAAMHHVPKSFMQWIIARADRIASGFEREKFEAYNAAEEQTPTEKNHYQARLLSLFEEVDLDKTRQITPANLKFRYPLKPMSVSSIFPQNREEVEPTKDETAQDEYLQLWKAFEESLKLIPQDVQSNLPLWLQSYESLMQVYMHSIPSATAFGARPDVSLYDHSKAVASLAVALWRYYARPEFSEEEVVKSFQYQQDGQEQAFLLIQGDFFGIQNFIFDDEEAGNSQKYAAKLLRGRSFYVSLFTEIAALKILEKLSLPATSQIINAAGKFLIVAPNTDESKRAIEEVQQELDDWFLRHTYGTAGVGLALESACADDFIHSKDSRDGGFDALMERLFNQLETQKFKRFNRLESDCPIFSEYLDDVSKNSGVCAINGRYPATTKVSGLSLSQLVADQIKLGGLLAKPDYTNVILYAKQPHHSDYDLKLNIFGYYVDLATDGQVQNILKSQASIQEISRVYDISLPPENPEEVLFKGLARRNLNAYVPLFTELDLNCADKYGSQAAEFPIEDGGLKTLHHLAFEDRYLDSNGQWQGISAIHTLKGDVDNLGLIFQEGLKGKTGQMTFAKMASLSRQLDQFFSVFLPWLCRKEFPNTYTVFAGGDDFFLMGAWRSQLSLAKALNKHFKNYVAQNPQIHFSVGLSLTKPNIPIRQIAEFGEHALDLAKSYNEGEKNAVTVFEQTLSWETFEAVSRFYLALETLKLENSSLLSSGYLYSLLSLSEQAQLAKTNPALNNWRSKFVYRTHRLKDKAGVNEKDVQQLIAIVGKGLNQYQAQFKIPLYLYIYKHRQI